MFFSLGPANPDSRRLFACSEQAELNRSGGGSTTKRMAVPTPFTGHLFRLLGPIPKQKSNKKGTTEGFARLRKTHRERAASESERRAREHTYEHATPAM